MGNWSSHPQQRSRHCAASVLGGGGIRTPVLERPTGSSPGAARW